MEWLSSLFNLGTSGAGGVVTGAIGGIVGGFAKYYQEKQRQGFEKEKWTHSKEMAQIGIRADADKLAVTIKADADRADTEALSASIQADANLSNANTPPWALAVKVVFRPFLTTLLVIVAAFMFYEMIGALAEQANALNQVFAPSELKEIIKYMVYTIYYTASTAAMWWFCDRAITPSFAK